MADETLQAISSEAEASGEEKTPENKELDGLVSNLALDYAKYLKVNVATEKAALDDEIEDILTRLDEFTSLVDMVRGDNALCLNTTLPEIYKKCEEMEKMFQRVDKLEQMVQTIKQNLDAMEEKVVEAEEKLDSSSVKRLFNSIQKPLFSKKGSSEPKKQVKYDPPEIFKTEDFFQNQPSTATEKSPAETPE